jgi:hypothetical protein
MQKAQEFRAETYAAMSSRSAAARGPSERSRVSARS